MNRTLSPFTLLALALLTVARTAVAGTFETNLHKSFPMASGGKLVLDADRGSVEIQKGSAATVEVDIFHLDTSGGDIQLRLPETIGAKVDARTRGGRVISELPVTGTGTQKAGALVGQLGQGGSVMTLRTSGGSIALKKI